MKLFTFDGLATNARVVDVYDGDTVTVVFYYNNQPIKQKMRLIGYDTPEMKPKMTMQNRDKYVAAANKAKCFLKQLILNKVVWIELKREEKYGRLLGDMKVYNNQHEITASVCDVMLKHGYGKKYAGGCKSEFTENDIDIINGIQ